MTDTERIEFLESLNSQKQYSGKCILRWSVTARGWRLHETVEDKEGFDTVREAIDAFIQQEKAA